MLMSCLCHACIIPDPPPPLLQDTVIKAFEITTEGMGEVASRLSKDFNKGLEREGDDVKVKMLITYVHSLPDGSEEGDFLALDLGGSNFRVLLIRKSTVGYAALAHSVSITRFTCCVFGALAAYSC